MGLVVLLALAGAAVASFSESAATVRQRELEAQLIWTGQQYQRALESYYWASPGRVKHLPVKLEELLRDMRFPQPVRHLRQLYPDPLQPEVPWGLLRQGNQIIGVYSQSDRETLRRANFAPGMESFEGSSHYTEWRFIFLPRPAPAAFRGGPA
jgi:type II secretory pathway pseudopilin PulG